MRKASLLVLPAVELRAWKELDWDIARTGREPMGWRGVLKEEARKEGGGLQRRRTVGLGVVPDATEDLGRASGFRRGWAEGDAGLGQVDVEGIRRGRNAKGKTRRLRSLTPDGHEPEAFPADRHGCKLTHFATILWQGTIRMGQRAGSRPGQAGSPQPRRIDDILTSSGFKDPLQVVRQGKGGP